jgi:hypothetical protein
MGKAASANGNRDATISAGVDATISPGDGAVGRNDTALKLTPRLAMAAKTSMMRKANAKMPALAKT